MNNLEIQREAIIEIVGTQHERRAVNHQNLFLQQNLTMKHQNDNVHDHNAVILLTEDGKELGFMPIGYASLYAPAIDSGRYNFTVEIVKSEPAPERPILIVKITSELKNRSEEDIERDILDFVQNVVNGYAQLTAEYNKFIDSEKVNVDELLSALDNVRLLQKLHSCSSDIIKSHGIEQTAAEYIPQTKESLTKYLGDLKADINDVLKIIKKANNEVIDIVDEEEYQRVQRNIYGRNKKFGSYNNLLSSLLNEVENYVNISVGTNSTIPETQAAEPVKPADEINDTLPITEFTMQEPEHDSVISNGISLTENAFYDWLISDGRVSDTTAKQYISNIHSIEKLYQTLFGIRKNIIGATSTDDVKTMIETLLQTSEYIDANERRHNGFSASLSKFAQFAEIYVTGRKAPINKKNYQPPISSESLVIKTVDLNNPHSCTYYKPCSFILNESKYSVGSWVELYTKFLALLYNDNAYVEILKGLIGISLCGRRIDFADKKLAHELRRAVQVSSDFFAEGNLSAADIIKHIKCLMELCSIDDGRMIIEYNTQEKDNGSVIADDDTGADNYEQLTISISPEQTTTDSKIETRDSADLEIPKSPVVDTEKSDSDSFTERLTDVSEAPDFSRFIPDISKPFVLKDTVIEILSSEAPVIAKYHEHKNGVSSKNLRELLKAYYGKTIGLFEISKLLMLDKTFQSVGKGCYILNAAMIPHKEAEPEHIELVSATIEEPIVEAAKSIHADYLPVFHEEGYDSLIEEESSHKPLSEPTADIEDVIKIIADISPQEPQAVNAEAGHIVLKLNGNVTRAYDYSDALSKVCEFAINCRPFGMARIAGQAIQLHGNNVFYRKATPVDGYNKLSNGLQLITIDSLPDLQVITKEIQKYCQISDDMITIICR